MKRRVPGRFSAAISRIRDGLGEDHCAKVVGRGPSLIRKWSDPDQPTLPNLRQALTLDVAFVTAGLGEDGEPPILTAYADRLDRLVKETPDQALDVIVTILSMQATMGSLAHWVIASGATTAKSPGDIADHDRYEILRLLDQLCEAADSMKGQLAEAITVQDK